MIMKKKKASSWSGLKPQQGSAKSIPPTSSADTTKMRMIDEDEKEFEEIEGRRAEEDAARIRSSPEYRARLPGGQPPDDD